MSETLKRPAAFSRDGTYVEATFVRFFDHDPAEVWQALTQPALLAAWLPPGSIAQDGRAQLDFHDSGIVIDSPVTVFAPERRLEFSWSSPGQPERPVAFELTPTPGGCRLDLSLRVPVDEDAGRAAAGWEAHLEMLACALEGVPIKFPFEIFKAARDVYRGALAV